MSERLKVTLALAGSALLHVLFALALLIGAWLVPTGPASEPPPEQKAIEVTLVSASPPEPKPAPEIAAAPTPQPKVTRSMLDSEGLKESEKAPDNPLFESDKNSVAASEKPATGTAPLPSQEGKERPLENFTTHDYSVGKGDGRAMEVSPAPTQTPSIDSFEKDAATPETAATSAPMFAPTPIPAPETNGFALGKPTPVPVSTPAASASPKAARATDVAMLATKPQPRPEQPKSESGYRAQKEQTKIEGSISNRGRAGVDAVGTPLGRYRKAIADAIGSRWYYYINQRMDLITVGDVHIKFLVTENGQVQSVRILSNTANNTFGEFCMRSVTEAKIPPLPPDVASKLEDGRLEIEYHFTVYPQ